MRKKEIIGTNNYVLVSVDYLCAIPEFAFLSYESYPSGTDTLSSKDVIGFRDYFWKAYFSNPFYLEKIERLFGKEQRNNVEEMAKHNLKRKLLDANTGF